MHSNRADEMNFMTYEQGYVLNGIEHITGYFDGCLLSDKQAEASLANEHECAANADEIEFLGFAITNQAAYFVRPLSA